MAKYKIETHFGCTSNCIVVNDKTYHIDNDPRYCLTESEQAEFNDAFFIELRRMFNDGEIQLYSLLEHFFEPDKTEVSGTCDQCGDCVTSNYYSF